MFNKVIYTIYNKTHSEVDYSPFSRLFSLFPFTGKQRDEETGYGYFGARYMDHEQMTMWLSVDPMSDKYPGISPYAYCAWNPVKLVDPDGEFPAPIHAVMVFKACMKTEKQLRAAVFLH